MSDSLIIQLRSWASNRDGGHCDLMDDAADKIERLRAALTPSAETKAAYIGEFFVKAVVDCDELGDDITMQIPIKWTTVKEIMARILKFADEQSGEKDASA